MGLFDKVSKRREKANTDQRTDERNDEALRRLDAGRKTLTAVLEGTPDAVRTQVSQHQGQGEAVGKITQVMAIAAPELQQNKPAVENVIAQIDAAKTELASHRTNIKSATDGVERAMTNLVASTRIELPTNLVADLVEEAIEDNTPKTTPIEEVDASPKPDAPTKRKRRVAVSDGKPSATSGKALGEVARSSSFIASIRVPTPIVEGVHAQPTDGVGGGFGQRLGGLGGLGGSVGGGKQDVPVPSTTPPSVQAPALPKIGSIKKALVGSKTVHWYEWNDKTGFEKSAKTIAKGTDLASARKTIDDKFAWIETVTGQQGYVHTEHVKVSAWGQVKNPRYEDKTRIDGGNLLESADGKKPGQTYKETNREWYLDQAVLMQALRDLEEKDPKGTDPKTQETKQRLGLAMLQSFSKGAAVDRKGYGDSMDIQTTPFKSDEGVYHRSGSGNLLLDSLQTTVAADMKIADWVDVKAGPKERFSRVQPLADPTFMEVLAREFPVYGLENQAKGSKPVDPKIDSVEKFGAAVDALLDNLAAGQAPDHTFVFDVSKLYVALACSPDKIEAQLSRPLERVFTQKAADALAKNDKLSRDGVVKSLMDQIQLVILTRQKGIDVLLVPPFFKPLSAAERDKNEESAEQMALRDSVDTNARDQFVKFGGHDSKKLDSAMISSGARIDPIAAKSALLELSGPEKLLASSGLKEAKLGTKGGRDFVVSKSLEKLTETGIFVKFRDLGSDKAAAPYLKFYPAATADLLVGLAQIKTAEGSIDDVFASRGLTEVLQTAYYRIMNAMGAAITAKTDIIGFMNHVEVIHDQMQMILAIAQPYVPGVDFAKGIIAQLKSAPKGEAPVVPDGLDATVSHKASAMHSVASIMSSVEAQKEKDQGNRNVNALVLRDNYYESAGAMHNAKTYDVTALDGDQLRGDGPDGRRDLAPQALIDPGALEDGKVVPKAPRGPVDLFLCDFHHNISVDRTHYQVEDVEHQVAQLLEKKLVAPKFTVAIDCTVDLVRSDDIRRFLARFKKQIIEGSMSVVLFRSAQKFDMLGMDNYYGGYTVTINNSGSFDAFNARINAKEDQVTGLAHQGMAHLAQHGGAHADAYRKALMDNTRVLYDKLPPACRLTGGNDSPLQIAQSDDPNNVFLDIQFPGYNDHFDFYNTFITWAHANGLGLTMRPSFGFATSNFTIIGGSKLRLNPGLEDASAMVKYASFFIEVQAIMAKTQASQLAGRKKADLDKAGIRRMEAAFKTAIASWSASAAPDPSAKT